MSRDGVLIIHHDRALNPNIARRDGRWIGQQEMLWSLPAHDLMQVDIGRLLPGSAYAARYPHQVPVDGATIPSLRDLIEMPEVQGAVDLGLNIEIKTTPLAPNETADPERIVDALVSLLDATGFRQRVRVQSFDWRNMVYLRSIAPDIELSFLTAERPGLDNLQRKSSAPSPWLAGHTLEAFGGCVSHLIRHLGGVVWAPYFEDIGEDDVRAAHDAGLKVVVWTVNEANDMRRLLGLGVDGIITDYPDVGRAVIDAVTQA